MNHIDYILDRLCEGVEPEVIEQVACLIRADEIRKGLKNNKPKSKPVLEKPPVSYISNKSGNHYLALSTSATRLNPNIPKKDIYLSLQLVGQSLEIRVADVETPYIAKYTTLQKYGRLRIYNKTLVDLLTSFIGLPKNARITCPVEWDGAKWIVDFESYVCE